MKFGRFGRATEALWLAAEPHVRWAVQGMKQLRQLTAQDLERFPVWRYEGPSDAVATVAPVEIAALAEETDEVFVVLTHFTLRDGTRLVGYCSPTDDSGMDYVQPVIVMEREHLPLFFEGTPPHPEPDTTCQKLRRTFDQVFPIRLRAEVPVDGRFVEHELETVEQPR